MAERTHAGRIDVDNPSDLARVILRGIREVCESDSGYGHVLIKVKDRRPDELQVMPASYKFRGDPFVG